MEVFFAEFTEDPWRIILEFKVILCAWGELVTDDVEIVLVPRSIVLVCDWTFEFSLTPGDLEKGAFWIVSLLVKANGSGLNP